MHVRSRQVFWHRHRHVCMRWLLPVCSVTNPRLCSSKIHSEVGWRYWCPILLCLYVWFSELIIFGMGLSKYLYKKERYPSSIQGSFAISKQSLHISATMNGILMKQNSRIYCSLYKLGGIIFVLAKILQRQIPDGLVHAAKQMGATPLSTDFIQGAHKRGQGIYCYPQLYCLVCMRTVRPS